jgi:hypothetical protein
LIGDGTGDGLTNPPGGVRAELVAAPILKLLDGLHQADVALLDEVEELESAVGVLLGDRDDEAKVGLDQLTLGLLGECLTALELDGAVAERITGHPGALLYLANLAELTPNTAVELFPHVLGNTGSTDDVFTSGLTATTYLTDGWP